MYIYTCIYMCVCVFLLTIVITLQNHIIIYMKFIEYILSVEIREKKHQFIIQFERWVRG